MTSRLYRTTRPLAAQVALVLDRLGIGVLGSPTTLVLIALYVSGLILLDERQTQTRVALFLPGRCHDALNRLLRVTALSTRKLMGLLIDSCKGHRGEGYLCLDDCVIEKAFAKKLPWAGWTYSFAKKRKVYGLHVMVLLWCISDSEGFRIPVAFRLWRPKRSCAAHTYKTKLKLSEEMLKEVVGSGLKARYIVFDTHYAAPGGSPRWWEGWGWCGSVRSIRGRSSTGAPSVAAWASWPGRWL
jgi:hypothetical protein